MGEGHEIAFAVAIVVVALLNSVGNNTFLTPNSPGSSDSVGPSGGAIFPAPGPKLFRVCRGPDVSAFRAVFMRHAHTPPHTERA